MQLQHRFKLSNKALVVDVDDLDSLEYCKAVYQFSWIPRVIKKTRRGGLHVYIPVQHSFVLRIVFGDDYKRLQRDMEIASSTADMHINVAFKSTEVGDAVVE